jgi:hypothetical protein
MQNLTTTDLLIAFFSGVGATIIGFFLTMLWEWEKTKKLESIVINTLKHELVTNEETLKNNLILLEQELDILDNRQLIINPLISLNADFTNLLFIAMPKCFKNDPTLISGIRILSRITKENNETINSRETYRINNEAMSNCSTRMKDYDQILHTQTNQLIKATQELLKNIDPRTSQ